MWYLKMTKMLAFKTRNEWIEARKNYIGGSDAAAVVGLNPYKDNVTLWLEKTKQKEPEDISGKPYVKYGTDAESSLRKLFALDHPEYKVFYRKNNIWLNSKYPWAHCSVDGWMNNSDGKLGVLEIKTTNIFQSRQKEKWRDRIPDNYYCQCLHAMAVMDAEFAILKAQLKSVFNDNVYLQTRHYFIDRNDVQKDIEYLMQQESKFAECVKNKIRPTLILPAI